MGLDISFFDMDLSFKLYIEPKAKQSTRIGKHKKTGRAMAFSDKSLEAYQDEILLLWKQQRPKGFEVIDHCINVSIEFAFAPTKNLASSQKFAIAHYQRVFKTTKPDLDNLTKPVLDALEGHIFTNDSRISILNTQKIYTHDKPHILVSISKPYNFD